MERGERRLSLREAADALGISEVSARRWIKAGKLTAYQPGRSYQIPESAVEELLEESEIRPKAHSLSYPTSGAEGRLASVLVGERERLKGLADRWERKLGEEIKAERGALFVAAGQATEVAMIADAERLHAASLVPDPDDELPEWEGYLRGRIEQQSDRLTRLKFEAYSRIEQAVEVYPSPEERARLHEEIADHLGMQSGDQAHA